MSTDPGRLVGDWHWIPTEPVNPLTDLIVKVLVAVPWPLMPTSVAVTVMPGVAAGNP
jgi:hypothetical protein